MFEEIVEQLNILFVGGCQFYPFFAGLEDYSCKFSNSINFSLSNLFVLILLDIITDLSLGEKQTVERFQQFLEVFYNYFKSSLEARLYFIEGVFPLFSHLHAEVTQINSEEDRIYYFFEFPFISFQPCSFTEMMIFGTSLIKRIIFIFSPKTGSSVFRSFTRFSL